MEQKSTISSPDADPGPSKVIEWEDFEQDLARLCSLSSTLNEAKEKKQTLQRKLQSLIQVKAELLSQSNELEEMREKLEARKVVMENMSTRNKVAALDAKKQEEWLSIEVRSLLVAGTALSKARRHLQESNRSLVEERGYVQLKNLQKTLRVRQQFMVSQVSLLFPVRTSIGPAQERELESFPSSHKSGNSAAPRPVTVQGSLTIVGLQLTMLPFTKMSFFTDKKEVQRSATALGYVAHAVSLVASYLEVPLRYPLRLGCSRSYINDYAPSIEPSSDLSSLTEVSSNTKAVEFPLFLEGQDTTRAAYAVFLLNKDLEQLLNFIGVKSVGPRHVLANLKELLRTILSADYIDT